MIFALRTPLLVVSGVILALVLTRPWWPDFSAASADSRSPAAAPAHSCGPQCRHGASDKSTPARSEAELRALAEAADQLRSFRQLWGPDQQRGALSAAEWREVRKRALARREAMRLLLREDPDTALELALGYAEYAALPPELQALVEQPFSTTAQLDAEIACGPDSHRYHRLLDDSGQSWELSMPSTQRVGLTKRDLPVQGIRLDELATVRPEALQLVEGADEAFVMAEWPSGQSDPAVCFHSGEPIEGPGVTAVLAGQVFRFQDLDALAAVDAQLIAADARPGMDVGSSQLMVAASGGQLGQFPAQQFSDETVAASYASTTGAKTALFILVDFSDASGQPAHPATLEQVVDLDCNDALARYSYNLTSMNGTVHPTTLRMPNPKATYTGAPGDSGDDNHNLLHTHAVAAYVGAGNPDPLTAYDTVCVVMGDIGFTWAGLATVGGQRMWLHNNISAETITHEFGHNYGLEHASYWKFDETNPASTNPVDPTGKGDVLPGDDSSVLREIEYGDLYDLMGDGNVADGHFHQAGKVFLGWIPGSDWVDLSTPLQNGTYRITRFDDPGATGSRGLRIAKSATSDHYWVGFRRDYSNIDDFANGAYLTWERALGNPSRNRTWLVDTTPLSGDGKADAPITLGRTYSDPASSVHITAVEVGGSAPNEWLDVAVHFGSFPGNNSPTGTLFGPTAAEARSSVLFNVEASDSDGDPLAYYWDMGDGVVKTNSPSIAHSWIQGGSYDISVTISDMKGGTVTLPLTVTVTDPLNSWSARTSGTSNHLSRIAANDTHAIIVGGGTYPYPDAVKILRSADGITWSNVTPSGTTNASFRDICWTGTRFVAVGEDYDFDSSGWEGVIYDSSDGITWTRRYQTNAKDTQLFAVTTNGAGVVVAAGFSGTVLRWTDLGGWSAVAAGIPTSQGLRGAAYGESTYVLVGHLNYSTGTETAWTSPDGLTWTEQTSGTGLPNNWEDLDVVHHTGSLFVASGSYARARYSSDQGLTWLTTQSGDRYELAGFATGAGLTYAVGINRDNGSADIDLVSADGQNWTVIHPGSVNNRNGLGFFANTFISVGDAGSIRQSGAVTASTTYTDFATTHFPGGGDSALTDANPDGDWASNLFEYALGGTPGFGASSPAFPVLSFDGANNPVLEISRAQRRGDVAYSVWWSTDLVDWTRQGLTIETDNATTLRVVADGVDTSGGRGFLKLQLDQ